jgi:hypothetical protein
MALSFVEVQFSDGYARTFTFNADGADHFAAGVAKGSLVTQVLLKQPGRPWVTIRTSEDGQAIPGSAIDGARSCSRGS